MVVVEQTEMGSSDAPIIRVVFLTEMCGEEEGCRRR